MGKPRFILDEAGVVRPDRNPGRTLRRAFLGFSASLAALLALAMSAGPRDPVLVLDLDGKPPLRGSLSVEPDSRADDREQLAIGKQCFPLPLKNP